MYVCGFIYLIYICIYYVYYISKSYFIEKKPIMSNSLLRSAYPDINFLTTRTIISLMLDLLQSI